MNCNPFPSAPIVNIGTPTACDCDTATGGNVSTGPTSTPQNYQFPTTTTSAVVPGGNALFTVQSPGAPQWAATGMLVWFPELEGYASIRSVIGDAITLKALTIPAGSTVQVGSRMVPAPPTQSEADVNPENSLQLTSIQGLNDGLPSLLQGSLGDMLFHNGSGFGKVKASPFVPLPGRPLVLTVKRDVYKGGVASSWSAPIWGGTGDNPAPEFITFPSLPALAVGQQPRALVEARYSLAVRETSRTLGVTVNFSGGIAWKRRSFCRAVTATAAATIATQLPLRADEGQDLFLMPIIVSDSPPESQPTPITVQAAMSEGTNTAWSHYIVEFRVLGYFI